TDNFSNKNLQSNGVDSTISTQIVPSKKNVLPNDAFRDRVFSSLTNKDDKVVFKKILTALDNQGLSVCVVLKQLFAIDDQSLADAKQKYPDPLQQKLFSEMYTAGIKKGYINYARKINLS